MSSPGAGTLLHPVRMRIILALARGRALTAQQLGGELVDVPQATLYRHLSRLLRAGVLRVEEEHQVRGAVEKVYALQSEVVDASLDVLHAGREDNMRFFTLFVAGLLGEFARYLQREQVDFAADGVGYRQEVLYLSDEEFAHLLGTMNVAMRDALANGPAPNRRRRVFSSVVMPADDTSEVDSQQ